MLNKQEAQLIAMAFIKTIEAQKPERPLSIISNKIIEKPYAWVFPFNTEEYVKSGDIRFEVPGFGPIVVDRETRKAHSAPSSINIEKYLKYYEQTRLQKK